MLKPQDVVVVLKLCAYAARGVERPPFVLLARDVGMSASEVHSAVGRARTSHLLHGPELSDRPNASAILEFLVHGIRYVFPAERGAITRGVPTSYAAPPLNALVARGSDPIPVWSSPKGKVRGVALEPLYRTVVLAAQLDPLLYELLALTDALREGRVRERNLAKEQLAKRLWGNGAV